MRLVKTRRESLNERQTGQLLELIEASEKVDRPIFQTMQRNRDFLKGDQWKHIKVRGKKSIPQVVLNLWYAHVKSKLPSVFFKEPTVLVDPTTPLEERKAPIWQLLLQNTILRNGYKKETKRSSLDTLVFGEGWKKVVYIKEAEDDEGRGGGPLTETPHQATRWMSLGIPASIRVPPQSVVVDLLAAGRDPDFARFIAIKYFKPLEEIYADPRNDNLPPRASLNTGDLRVAARNKRFGEEDMVSPVEYSPTTAQQDSDGDVVSFYEVWVYQLVGLKLYKQMLVIMPGAKEPIRKPVPWEDLVGAHFPGYPVHQLTFNDVPDSTAMSDLTPWEDVQWAVNWIASKALDALERHKRITTVMPQMLASKNKGMAQLKGPSSHEFIEVSDHTALNEYSVQGVSIDHYRMIDSLTALAQRISGITENQQGASGIRTATEAALIDRTSQSKLGLDVDAMRDFLKVDIEKLAALIRHVADRPFVFRLVGDVGPIEWQQFTPEDIDWAPDINIEVDSFRDAGQQEEIQKWTTLLGAGGQLFQFYGPMVRLDLIYAKLMEAAGVDNPEEFLGDLVDDRLHQMIEIVEMTQGNEAPVLPTDAHEVHRDVVLDFLNSDTGQALAPEIQQVLLAHAEQHEQLLQEQQSKQQGPKTPSFDNFFAGGNGAATPANAARSATAREREATPEVPGTGGQRSI